MGRLREKSCERCKVLCGEKGGLIIERAKSDPEFARKILEAMRSPAREAFMKIVGDPGPRAPGTRLV
jgi:hypothetical protein